MSALHEAVNAVLKAWATVPVDQSNFHTAYDQFVWIAVTSTREELHEVFRLFANVPYFNLPAPLQVLVSRLVGLEYRDDTAVRATAVNWIACYCPPEEERTATQGIAARRDS